MTKTKPMRKAPRGSRAGVKRCPRVSARPEPRPTGLTPAEVAEVREAMEEYESARGDWSKSH